jgi:hypothetical protein
MGDTTNAYRILFRTSEEKGLLHRPAYTWGKSSKMNLQEMGCGMDSVGSG